MDLDQFFVWVGVAGIRPDDRRVTAHLAVPASLALVHVEMRSEPLIDTFSPGAARQTIRASSASPPRAGRTHNSAPLAMRRVTVTSARGPDSLAIHPGMHCHDIAGLRNCGGIADREIRLLTAPGTIIGTGPGDVDFTTRSH
jgi:hypothetical protein